MKMTEQVKGALIIGVAIIVATVIYVLLTDYYSPYRECIRSVPVRADVNVTEYCGQLAG